jgi:hypothetical protein
MPRPWSKPGLHLAVALFGTGLGVLMLGPVILFVAFAEQVPIVPGLVIWALPEGDWFNVIVAGIAWVVGLATTYAIVGWAIRSGSAN